MKEHQETDELEYIDLSEKIGAKKKERVGYHKTAIICCLIFGLGVVVAGSFWITQMLDINNAEDKFEELLQNTATVESEEDFIEVELKETETQPELSAIDKLKEMGVPIPDNTIDFADLQQNTNQDIYAWIYIPDSVINYPILQHPTDNSYYLNYNLDGSKGRPGCIYTEDYNAKDFSDPNTVLYGHNMRNGTMFADLHKYEDVDFFDENPYVYIYTPGELLIYKVFAAFEHSNEHLLYNHDFSNKAVYQVFLDEIYNQRSMNCNIREDVEVTTDDRLLTLSTCVTSKPDNRYLVIGVLLNED
uniref:class B sortase n=1 Tax=Acetatifactor sp. TaxID=1872090 RepID=UPI004056CBF6